MKPSKKASGKAVDKAAKKAVKSVKSASPQWDMVQSCVDLLVSQGLTGFEWEDPSGFRISLKKEVTYAGSAPMAYLAGAPAPSAPKETSAAASAPAPKPAAPAGKEIKCPFVGTFYSASSPTSAPYVRVGSKVKKGDTLCIIEAMKLMNSLEAEDSGEILEVLAKNGEPVEFGTALFRIRPE
jgi:acetyl-CoA carboxylase biotin carboxyl carrier protein